MTEWESNLKEVHEVVRLDSIEVSRNAKGDYSFKIKRYYNAEEEPDVVLGKNSYERVVSNIREIILELEKQLERKPVDI